MSALSSSLKPNRKRPREEAKKQDHTQKKYKKSNWIFSLSNNLNETFKEFFSFYDVMGQKEFIFCKARDLPHHKIYKLVLLLTKFEYPVYLKRVHTADLDYLFLEPIENAKHFLNFHKIKLIRYTDRISITSCYKNSCTIYPKSDLPFEPLSANQYNKPKLESQLIKTGDEKFPICFNANNKTLLGILYDTFQVLDIRIVGAYIFLKGNQKQIINLWKNKINSKVKIIDSSEYDEDDELYGRLEILHEENADIDKVFGSIDNNIDSSSSSSSSSSSVSAAAETKESKDTITGTTSSLNDQSSAYSQADLVNLHGLLAATSEKVYMHDVDHDQLGPTDLELAVYTNLPKPLKTPEKLLLSARLPSLSDLYDSHEYKPPRVISGNKNMLPLDPEPDSSASSSPQQFQPLQPPVFELKPFLSPLPDLFQHLENNRRPVVRENSDLSSSSSAQPRNTN